MIYWLIFASLSCRCSLRVHRVQQFKVLLFNDNGNTREYVSRSLVQVVGMPEDQAYHIMQQVRLDLETKNLSHAAQPQGILCSCQAWAGPERPFGGTST